MRIHLLLCALAVVSVNGEEATVPVPTMREKLRAKILESAPPPAPRKPEADVADDAAAPPPVVMQPLVVAESRIVREVTAELARKEEEKREERFTPLKGGKITSIGPMQVGSWWSVDEGWTFFRLRKPPTQRQIETSEAKMKNLQELAAMAAERQPIPKSHGTTLPASRPATSDR